MSPTGSVSRCGGTATPGAIVSDVILADPGIFAFWKLNETGGNTAVDSGPGGLDLTRSGASPTWNGPIGPPGDTSAVFNSDWQLVRAAGFASLAAGDMTAEIWIYRTANNFLFAMGQGDPVFGTSGWVLGAFDRVTQPPGWACVFIGNGGTTTSIGNLGPAATLLNTWYYLVTTRTANLWRLYVNGAQQTNTTTFATNSLPGLYVGSLTGCFADESYAALYSRALSADEIAVRYTLYTT